MPVTMPKEEGSMVPTVHERRRLSLQQRRTQPARLHLGLTLSDKIGNRLTAAPKRMHIPLFVGALSMFNDGLQLVPTEIILWL